MAGPRRLTHLVSESLPRLALPDGPLVVALSGGADSAALAYLTTRARGSPRALHVDHGLAHSPQMRAAAEAIAAHLGLQLEVVRTEVAPGASPEGQARAARYRAFASATDDGEALLTAHTRNDNAETILINMIRGTGPSGLAGIPSFRPPNIHRPILSISGSHTREIAALAGLPFRDDPMNRDPTLTRNRLRHRVVPVLEELNPNLISGLARMAALIGEDDIYLDSAASRLAPMMEEGRASIARAVLLSSPLPLAKRALAAMAAHVVGSQGVTSALIDRAWAVTEGRSPSETLVSGVEARRQGAMMVIEASPPAAMPGDSGEQVALSPGIHRLGDIVYEVFHEEGPCLVAPLGKWAAIFPAATDLRARPDGWVLAGDTDAWLPGEKRLPVAWYTAGTDGYLVVRARRDG